MKKKLLVPVLCILMMLIGGFATWAYLTSQDSVTNTFTTGDVEIMLDETNVDEKGLATEGRNSRGNAYHLLPGMPYDKDPTVHVVNGSEDCYVRMIVTVTNIDQLEAAIPANKNPDFYMADGTFKLQEMCAGTWNAEAWECVSAGDGVYEFRYKEIVRKVDAPTDGTVAYTHLPALFTTIKVPGFVDNDHLAELEGVEILVEAHAIQEAGFKNADEAWAAFKK